VEPLESFTSSGKQSMSTKTGRSSHSPIHSVQFLGHELAQRFNRSSMPISPKLVVFDVDRRRERALVSLRLPGAVIAALLDLRAAGSAR
jgi:hypothetical protein